MARSGNQALWVEDTLSFDRFAAFASLRLFRSELPPAFSEVVQPLANFLFQSSTLVFGDSSGQIELSRVRIECNSLHRYGFGPPQEIGVLPSFRQHTLVYSPATHAHLLRTFSAIGPAVSREDRTRNPATGPNREPDVCPTAGDGGERGELADGKGRTRFAGRHPSGEPSAMGGGLFGDHLCGTSGGSPRHCVPCRPSCEAVEG